MQFEKLILFTSNLAGQKAFYSQILGCPLTGETTKSISFQLGQSILQFKYAASVKPYHFAINIPAFQETDAHAWLQKRVSILPYQEREIVDFSNWNARAIYFYDADKNIVELIARRNLKQTGTLPFSAYSFLEISEIGLPVAGIKTIFKQLNAQLGVTVFDGNFDKFCAIGEERGLFIVIDKHKKDWFPLNDKAFSADFELVTKGALGKKIVHFKEGRLTFYVN